MTCFFFSCSCSSGSEGADKRADEGDKRADEGDKGADDGADEGEGGKATDDVTATGWRGVGDRDWKPETPVPPVLTAAVSL